jgi:hypothetical protein
MVLSDNTIIDLLNVAFSSATKTTRIERCSDGNHSENPRTQERDH